MYDYSYDSSDPKSDNYASQETVWNDLGTVVLDNAWDGYNVTLFAYGQTGSGKSYSMTGGNTPDSAGIMPRATREIFRRISENKDPELTYSVEVSMLEVYMEKIHDLFDPKNGGKNGLVVFKINKLKLTTIFLNLEFFIPYTSLNSSGSVWKAVKAINGHIGFM